MEGIRKNCFKFRISTHRSFVFNHKRSCSPVLMRMSISHRNQMTKHWFLTGKKFIQEIFMLLIPFYNLFYSRDLGKVYKTTIAHLCIPKINFSSKKWFRTPVEETKKVHIVEISIRGFLLIFPVFWVSLWIYSIFLFIKIGRIQYLIRKQTKRTSLVTL